MGILDEATGEIRKQFEETPGFGYVAALATAILGIVLKSTAPESTWPIALMAIAISLAAYWLGGFLDGLLFDPFYGVPPKEAPRSAFGKFRRRWFIEPIRWRAQRGALAADMIAARANAAKRFHPTNQGGIYKTAKKLLKNTEAWDGRMKLLLDLSKATRTLIIPAVCLLAWQLLESNPDFSAARFFGRYDNLAWLGHPISAISIAVISTVLYVNLRLRHMRVLYKKVAAIRAFSFVVRLEATAGSSTSEALCEVLWSVGERVVSKHELPVFPDN